MYPILSLHSWQPCMDDHLILSRLADQSRPGGNLYISIRSNVKSDVLDEDVIVLCKQSSMSISIDITSFIAQEILVDNDGFFFTSKASRHHWSNLPRWLSRKESAARETYFEDEESKSNVSCQMHLRRNQFRFRKEFIHLQIVQWSDGSFPHENSTGQMRYKRYYSISLLRFVVNENPLVWPLHSSIRNLFSSVTASTMTRSDLVEWWVRRLDWQWTHIHDIMIRYSDKRNTLVPHTLKTIKMRQKRQVTHKDCDIIRR